MMFSKRVLIAVGCVVAVVLLAASALWLFGRGSTPTVSEAGSISNAPSASASAPTPASVESDSPTDVASVPAVDTDAVSSRLGECLSRVSDRSQSAMNMTIGECFYFYSRHLSPLYGLGAISPGLSVGSLDVVDSSTAQVKASLVAADGTELGSLTAFYVASVDGFKVTSVELSEWSAARVPDVSVGVVG